MKCQEIRYKESDVHKLLSCHPQNKEHFSFLLRLMQRNVVIPLFGAGVSKNYGYPGWKEFLLDQGEKNSLSVISTLVGANKYEMAASKLYECLAGNMEFMLMQTFEDHKYKTAKRSPEIELIPKIFRSLMLTTNFDEVIELLYAKVNGEYIEKLTPMSLSNMKVIQKRIACGEPTLLKLHGDVATREFVFTEQEYNAAYGVRVLDTRLPLPKFLHDVLLSKIILFLGCSLEDDRTLQVVEQSQIDGSMSFALLELPSTTENKIEPWKPILNDDVEGEFSKRRAFINEHNIIPIWYPYKCYEALKIFLVALAYRVNSEYKLSITIARDTLKRLLSDGKSNNKKGDISEAYHCYTEAENILNQNSNIFTDDEQIQTLKEIKKFNDTNGFAIERRDVIKKIITLTKQASPYNGLDLAMVYHDLGYTYERYRYYRLMLKAMVQSNRILENVHDNLSCKIANLDKDEWKDYYSNAALIYTSLGYAYLKNGDNENAKYWYCKAKTLCERDELRKNSRAFILNGLYRYYNLLGETKKAIETLDQALELRRTLLDSNDILPQHIINSHSNKIHVYLTNGLVDEAKKEYDACMREDNIQDRLWNFPDAKCRILEDYGDILQMDKNYNDAYLKYKEALQYRRYLHISTDIIASEIYLKIADSLEKLNRYEEALEYVIQSYVLQEKILGKEHLKLKSVKCCMERLGEKLSYDCSKIQQRLDIQSNFLEYRYDEKIDDWEDRLIQEFEL